MSTVWPCDLHLDCDCADSQITRNYSSEAPDPFTYFSLRYYQGRPPLNADPRDYVTPSGPGICYSPVSPQAANDCALHNAQDPIWRTWPPPRFQFGNAPQTCHVLCPAGSAFSYTVPANTFFSNFSQAEADALAASRCQSRGFNERQCPPIVITQDATEVSTDSAVLNGTVNPNNEDTIAYFEWGTTTAYGNLTATQMIHGSVHTEHLIAVVGGLSPGTYHYRIVAFNTKGHAEGEDKTFTIVSTCPIDWTQMVWTFPVNSIGIGGSITKSAEAGSFSGALVGPSGATPDTQLQMDGRLTYTGDPVPVKLHVEVTVASGSLGDFMTVYHDGNVLFNVPGGDLIAVGSHDYYFNIPVSSAQEIKILQTMNAGMGGTLSTESEISCDCGVPVYQIDGYNSTIAAAIVALADSPNPSTKPEWDGKFRLNPDTGLYDSTPYCYAINGTDAVVELTLNQSQPTSDHCNIFWTPFDCGFRCPGFLTHNTTPSDFIQIGPSGIPLYNGVANGLGAFFTLATDNPLCGATTARTFSFDPTFFLGSLVFSVSAI